MKTNKILLSITFCFLTIVVFSQKQIVVEENIQPMLKGNKACFIVDIPQANVKDVERALKKEIGGKFFDNLFTKGTDGEIQEVGDEIIILNTVFEPISSDTINIYCQIYDKKEETRVIMFIEHDTIFIQNTESGQWEDHIAQKAFGAKNWLRKFGVDQYKIAVEEELKDKKTILRNLEKELISLENNTEKNLKNIESNKQRILNDNDEINILDSDIESKGIEIQKQKTIVSELKGGDKDTYSEAKKELKSLEKEKKKMQNRQETLRKRIVSSEVEIQESERTIESNKVEQKYKTDEIDQQKDIVKAVEEKLKNIK